MRALLIRPREKEEKCEGESKREKEREQTRKKEGRGGGGSSREPFSYPKASVIDPHVRYMADTHFIDTTNFSTSLEKTMAARAMAKPGHASFSHE